MRRKERNFFRKRCGAPCVHRSLVQKSLRWTRCVHSCVQMCTLAFVCVCVPETAERWRKWRQSWLGISAYASSDCVWCWRWKAVEVWAWAWVQVFASFSDCLPRAVEGLLLCPCYGWLQRARCFPVVPQKQQCSRTGVVPVRAERANICLSQKKKKKKILMKVHIDAIN